MCGITGVFDFQSRGVDEQVVISMARSLNHRGPDDESFFFDKNCGLGFKRLSIIDIKHGQQPFRSSDGSVILICNGEIFNYKELRNELTLKGYEFKSDCDVEVILHAYLEYGTRFIKRLNGQFAFVIYDSRNRSLLLARDHFGICPLFYASIGDCLIFGSEIKALLKFPALKREVDLNGLDQILTLPGLVSPATMFKNVKSVKPGHLIIAKNHEFVQQEYWDVNYPDAVQGQVTTKPEEYYIEKLEDLLLKSVSYRLNADVPIGYYLSGGLDSSLIAGLIKKIKPQNQFDSFSISFPDADEKQIDESFYQRLMSGHVGSNHHEVEFRSSDIYDNLKKAVFCAESPLKETYNTCSLALSANVNREKIKVILSGEGADELFGGYVGYKLDALKSPGLPGDNLEELMEEQYRLRMWGDPNFFYEKNYYDFAQQKRSLYSEAVNYIMPEFDCTFNLSIDKDKLKGRSDFDKRSYLDLKVRLADHLMADHCDRTSYANSIEGRYPFLDINIMDFLAEMPLSVKLKGLNEKYILKVLAKKYVPEQICRREKFSFVAPGSPSILADNIEWVNDLLSYDMIKRQGYFNPDTIEKLKKIYTRKDFKLNLPFDTDLLITVLTFNIFLTLFDMPDFSG
ncbi:asparagine synthase (glutamine-hydrolyzing) [Pedobacter sp. D749]|uniref:asparagine synthase (glutamine-hydrolyzing) n=1 Tax=Pedobacter sp. D749 TaxID=2856523 RepID=UPI001C5896E0|nr:asparagine synthase (glutamine-hydrolyzing) [Pedobacter sp. D749]QXU43267.1 asparagine synthase (glutamine-hydrolyzing) [Pedobacter sp. D749]